MTRHETSAARARRYPGRRRHEDRREAILEAATDAFYRHGYNAASSRDIARQAGITQATVYYHFKNKEEILLTIITEFSDQLFESLLAALARDSDPVTRLRNAVTQHILFTKTHRRQVKIILEDKKSLGPELNARVKEKEKSIFNLYRTYLKELQAAGIVRNADLIPMTFSMFGIINSLYHWYRTDKPLTIERIAEEIADLLLNGLLCRPGVAEATRQEGGERCCIH